MATEALRSKSWNEFTAADAPSLDLLVTVCDSAAAEPCPVVFGDFTRVHWSLPDPAGVSGSVEDIAQAFARTHQVLLARLQEFVALPVEEMEQGELVGAMQRIESAHPALPLGGAA